MCIYKNGVNTQTKALPRIFEGAHAECRDARNIDITTFERIVHHEFAQRWQRYLLLQAQSCRTASPCSIPRRSTSFRRSGSVWRRLPRDNAHCFVCNGYWDAGYDRSMMVPLVKLAHGSVRPLLPLFCAQLISLQNVFDIVHRIDGTSPRCAATRASAAC